MDYYSRYYRQLFNGERRKPRGLDTVGLTNVTFNAPPYTTWRRPGDNILIGVMEGLQFIAGTFDKKQIARVAPNAKLDLFTSQSSYGPRCGKQLDRVINAINRDKYTRQALIILPTAEENLDEHPCTTCLQYQVEGDSLLTTITMRSSDAIWGLPYDLIQFNFISHVVAVCTGNILGDITINIGNAHVYTSTGTREMKFVKNNFSLPSSINTVDEWRKWANTLIPDLNQTYLISYFSFRE